jgi:NADPH-dependent 2,4-dienoyl-CoA reductase/sulfur reductase-like enzyme
MKIVIIGGVAGGATAAARMRRLSEDAEIIMLERGPDISFANCGLPYYVGGAIKDEAALRLMTPPAFKKKSNVDVRTMSRADAIDLKSKTVTVTGPDGQYEESYDKLLLATGAEPLRPPFPGADLPGVFTLRSIGDSAAIKKYIAEHEAKTALIVGGGYIGMEMAENLTLAGLKVTVVEMDDHAIAPLDYDMATDVHKYVRSKGVTLLLKSQVVSIAESGTGLKVALGSGEIEADLVLLSVGVRPDTKLASAAGLAVNAKGALIVDDHMRTSDPNVWAVGDAVQITNKVTGQPGFVPLAGPANKQGRIAADNMFGFDAVYDGTQGSSALKLFDMTVACTGINEKEARRLALDFDKVYLLLPTHVKYYPGVSELAMKVIYEKKSGRLLGAQVIGMKGVDKRCDVLATAIRLGADSRRPHEAGALLRAALHLRQGPRQYGRLRDRKPHDRQGQTDLLARR